MTFLNFSQLPKSVFRPNFLGKHFPENQAKFSLTGKCFLLTNFSNDKQTQKNLKSSFSEIIFRETFSKSIKKNDKEMLTGSK